MATNSIIDELGRPTNSGNVLNIAKAYHAYNEGTGSKGDIYKSYIPIAMQTPISSSFASLNRDEMMRRIAADKRTADILTGYINDDNDKNWKAWKDEVISNKIGRYIRPGSPLFNFFRHMSGIFGIGKHFASSAIRNKLKSIAGNARI